MAGIVLRSRREYVSLPYGSLESYYTVFPSSSSQTQTVNHSEEELHVSRLSRSTPEVLVAFLLLLSQRARRGEELVRREIMSECTFKPKIKDLPQVPTCTNVAAAIASLKPNLSPRHSLISQT